MISFRVLKYLISIIFVVFSINTFASIKKDLVRSKIDENLYNAYNYFELGQINKTIKFLKHNLILSKKIGYSPNYSIELLIKSYLQTKKYTYALRLIYFLASKELPEKIFKSDYNIREDLKLDESSLFWVYRIGKTYQDYYFFLKENKKLKNKKLTTSIYSRIFKYFYICQINNYKLDLVSLNMAIIKKSENSNLEYSKNLKKAFLSNQNNNFNSSTRISGFFKDVSTNDSNQTQKSEKFSSKTKIFESTNSIIRHLYARDLYKNEQFYLANKNFNQKDFKTELIHNEILSFEKMKQRNQSNLNFSYEKVFSDNINSSAIKAKSSFDVKKLDFYYLKNVKDDKLAFNIAFKSSENNQSSKNLDYNSYSIQTSYINELNNDHFSSYDLIIKFINARESSTEKIKNVFKLYGIGHTFKNFDYLSSFNLKTDFYLVNYVPLNSYHFKFSISSLYESILKNTYLNLNLKSNINVNLNSEIENQKFQQYYFEIENRLNIISNINLISSLNYLYVNQKNFVYNQASYGITNIINTNDVFFKFVSIDLKNDLILHRKKFVTKNIFENKFSFKLKCFF